MNDIETRSDIDDLMVEFYQRAFADDLLGHIFRDVAKLDLESHLPVIGDFWETLLLGNQVYSRHGRNPLRIHGELGQKTPIEAPHFRRWLQIFNATVDEMFRGERASFAKMRANAIANRMLNFINGIHGLRSPFVQAS